MKRFKSIVLAALAVFVVAAYIPVQPVSAQSTGSSALSLVPKKEYIVDPGESIEDKLTIKNLDSSNDLNLSLRVIDFTYTNDGGTPKLMLDQNTEPTPWSLKSYLKMDELVQVAKGGTGNANLKISLPKNLGAGSYYSAIIYSTAAPNGGNVGLSASGVTLVFVNVPGETKEDLTLKKIGAYDPNKNGDNKYTFITGAEPKHIGYTIENRGNITAAPVGAIKMKNLIFGHENTLAEVNPNKSLALIGQTRTFSACIKLDVKKASNETPECISAGLWPGVYKVSAELYYGQNGNQTKEITKTGYFWYLPLWFVIVVILLALAVAFAIWRLVVAIKSKTNAPRGRRSKLMRR